MIHVLTSSIAAEFRNDVGVNAFVPNDSVRVAYHGFEKYENVKVVVAWSRDPLNNIDVTLCKGT